jgi:hypothetical protein
MSGHTIKRAVTNLRNAKKSGSSSSPANKSKGGAKKPSRSK